MGVSKIWNVDQIFSSHNFFLCNFFLAISIHKVKRMLHRSYDITLFG
jgi:hypothetical protein